MKNSVKKIAYLSMFAFAAVLAISIYSGSYEGIFAVLFGGGASIAMVGAATEESINSLLGIDDLNGEHDLDGTDEMDRAMLGAALKRGIITNAAQKKLIIRHANAKVKNALITSVLSSGQKFLVSQASKLELQSRADIAAGRARFAIVDYYFRRKLTGGAGTIFEVNQPSDKLLVGIQNMNNNNLVSGENMALESVKLSYAFSAADGGTTDPGNVVYTNAVDAETAGTSPLSIPTALLNGEIELRVEGNSIFKLPCKKFFRESFSMGVGTQGMTDAVKLPSPILIKENQPINFQITLANGTALPSGNHFIEVTMQGVVSRPRS